MYRKMAIEMILLKLFRAVGGCLLIACATFGQSKSAHQLTMILPNDQGFDTLIKESFTGVDRMDGYNEFRPFLVILRNDGERAVRTYMVAWEMRLFSGQERKTGSFVERNDRNLANERVSLAPGEVRLVSDRFDVGPEEFQSTREHNWVQTTLTSALGMNRYSSTDKNSITASVAVVFDDDTCSGPDHYRLCQRFQAEIDAEHDIAEELLSLMDKKASEQEVVAHLKKQAGASASAMETLTDSAFDRAFWRGRQGEKLLALYNRGGLESVMLHAWRVEQRQRHQLLAVAAQ
jgi:hypothetical protein